jgi:hypothetical protein
MHSGGKKRSVFIVIGKVIKVTEETAKLAYTHLQTNFECVLFSAIFLTEAVLKIMQ